MSRRTTSSTYPRVEDPLIAVLLDEIRTIRMTYFDLAPKEIRDLTNEYGDGVLIAYWAARGIDIET